MPDFFKTMSAQLSSVPLDDWKVYLRFHLVNSRAPYLSAAFVNQNFDFYRKYLHGAEELQPRWKRCVEYVDDELGEALGQAYVRKTFPPELKAATLKMTQADRRRDGDAHPATDWMSPATKQQALEQAPFHSQQDRLSGQVARLQLGGNCRATISSATSIGHDL